MIIRPATTDDSHAIALVHVSSWQHAYRGIVNQTYLDELSVEVRENRWNDILLKNETETLVADLGEHIAGFISIGRSRDLPDSGEVGEIYSIYLDAPYWSVGLGQKLWAAASSRLHELGFVKVLVWVFSANDRAIKFYNRIGFTSVHGMEKSLEINGEQLQEICYGIALNNPDA